MDVDTYSRVLTKRGENPHEIPDGSREGHTRADIAFKKDLIRKKVVWYNNEKSDYHAFLKNYHPLYSICTAPKKHPFSRGERLVVFICDMGFAAILAIFVATITADLKGDDPYDTESDPDTYNDDETTDKGAVIMWQCIASVFCGLIKAITNGILKYIAICPCCQTNSCSNICRRFWECIGRCLICMWSCIVLFMLIIFIVMAIEWNIFQGFIISFIISNISGWFFSWLLLSFCFKIKWKKEKKNKKDILKKFKINYIEYEKYEKGIQHENINDPLLLQHVGNNEGDNDQITTVSPQQIVYMAPQGVAIHPVTTTIQTVQPPQPVVILQPQPQTIQYVVGTQQQNVETLPNGWRAVMTNDGRIYYQNDITKETQWTKPIENN